MKRKLALLMAILLIVVSVVGCSSSTAGNSEEVKAVHLKMNLTTNENSTWFIGASKFKELVEERTNGKYIIDIFPSEQLSGGNQVKGLEMVQTNTTDVDIHSVAMYSILDPKFIVLYMPWLIPTYEEADAVIAGEGGKAVFKLAEENGVVPLAFGESGYRQITNNKRPIKSPADLEGIKLRVPGIKMFIDLYGVLGADPTSMNFAEVFTALQQGTIDGEENPLDIIKSSKFEEVQKYLSIWNYIYDPLLLSVSTGTWERLNDEEKVIFQECATEAMNYQKEQNRLRDEENLKYLEENMEVYKMTAEEIAAFKEASKPVYEAYEEIIGLDLLKAFGYQK